MIKNESIGRNGSNRRNDCRCTCGPGSRGWELMGSISAVIDDFMHDDEDDEDEDEE